MLAQLNLAVAPVFVGDYARLACFRKFRSAEGNTKKPDVRITGFAYGEMRDKIKEATKKGLLVSGTTVVANLKKGRDKGAYFINDVAIAL